MNKTNHTDEILRMEYIEEPFTSLIEDDFNKSLDRLRDNYHNLPISTIQTILNLAHNV